MVVASNFIVEALLFVSAVCFPGTLLHVPAGALAAEPAQEIKPRSANGAHWIGKQVVVEAGKHDRTNVPVSVGLELSPQAYLNSPLVALKGPDGKLIPVEIDNPGLLAPHRKDAPGAMLWFVLPSLAARQSITYTIVEASKPFEPQFSWHDTPGKSDQLRFGDRPVLQYMYEPLDESTPQRRNETFKVYHHVYDPETGTHLLTKGPGGLYPHHRGLFYGFRLVTYDKDQHVDIWHCLKDTHQAHKAIESSDVGPVLGRQLLEIAWNGNGKKTFATEHREMTVYNVPGGTLIDFADRLVPTEGTVKLDGDPQHAGFHFRAAQEVADKTKKQTYYLRPDGKGKLDETRNWDARKSNSLETKKSINLPWNAMSFVVGGKRYTALYMDSPLNPKPARYSERDYGRFGSYFVANATPEKPLDVRYRVWVQAGEMTRQQAAAMRADFVDPVKAMVH